MKFLIKNCFEQFLHINYLQKIYNSFFFIFNNRDSIKRLITTRLDPEHFLAKINDVSKTEPFTNAAKHTQVKLRWLLMSDNWLWLFYSFNLNIMLECIAASFINKCNNFVDFTHVMDLKLRLSLITYYFHEMIHYITH